MTSSSDGPWSLLGLDGPAADAAAVRRAFAGQLKAIDMDAEPQRFIRLRQAFEEAVRLVEQGGRPEAPDDVEHVVIRREAEVRRDPPADEDVARRGMADLDIGGWDARPRAPPPEPHRFSQHELAAFRTAFAAAVAAVRLEPARKLYREGLARALIPLGEEGAALAQLIGVGLDDPAASVTDLRALAREHELTGGVRSALPRPLSERLRARLAAEDWLEAQLKLARRIPVMQPFPARAARLVTGRWAVWRLMSGDVAWVRAQLPALRQHGPLLGGRIDPARAEALQRRIDRLLNPGPLQRGVGWAVLIAIAVSFVMALIHPGH